MASCRVCGASLITQACAGCPPAVVHCPGCGAENLVERESADVIAAVLKERRKGKR